MKKETKEENLRKSLEMLGLMVEVKIAKEDEIGETDSVVNFDNEVKSRRRKRRADLLSEMDVKLYQKTRDEEKKKVAKKITKDLNL